MQVNFDIVSILKKFAYNSKRVINVSYKPTRPEFNKSIKIIIIGIAIIGMIGFVMSVVIALIAGTPILP